MVLKNNIAIPLIVYYIHGVEEIRSAIPLSV